MNNAFADRIITVVFNSKSKAENDLLFSQITNWEHVDATSYEEDLRQNLPLEDRFDRGSVLVDKQENAKAIVAQLSRLEGVKVTVGPLHTLDLYG